MFGIEQGLLKLLCTKNNSSSHSYINPFAHIKTFSCPLYLLYLNLKLKENVDGVPANQCRALQDQVSGALALHHCNPNNQVCITIESRIKKKVSLRSYLAPHRLILCTMPILHCNFFIKHCNILFCASENCLKLSA